MQHLWEETRITCKFLVGEPLRKITCGRLTCSWQGNIKVYHVEICCKGLNWVRIRSSGMACKHGDKCMGFLTGGNLLTG
jgi:hypothetical protein